jgi:hypothetical protein
MTVHTFDGDVNLSTLQECIMIENVASKKLLDARSRRQGGSGHPKRISASMQT